MKSLNIRIKQTPNGWVVNWLDPETSTDKTLVFKAKGNLLGLIAKLTGK